MKTTTSPTPMQIVPDSALKRQVKPSGIDLAGLDPSAIYIAPPGFSMEKQFNATVPVASGSSKTKDTALLFETTHDPTRKNKAEYAVSSGGKVTPEEFLIRGREKLTPPDDDTGMMAKGYIALPSRCTDYGSEEELDSEIKAYFHRYVDVAPHWETLMLAYVKLTWVHDLFSALPYLRFLGPKDTGKTSMLKCMGHICYRSISLSGSLSAAVLFRLVDEHHGTLVIDEADFSKSDMHSEITKVLNDGYAKGSPVWRCGQDNKPIPYNPFGPKVLNSRRRFTDLAFESRCITLQTYTKKPRADILCQTPIEIFSEAQELRNKLLAWRFHNYYRIRPDETGLKKRLESRLVQIGVPLVAVMGNDPIFERELIGLLTTGAEEQSAESDEVIVAQAIINLMGEREKAILFPGGIGQQAAALKQAMEPQAVEIDKEDKPKYSGRRVGEILRGFGLKRGRRETPGYPYTILKSDVAALRERYGLEAPAPAVKGKIGSILRGV